MKKILVIDDDMDICHLLKRFLGKNGFEVTTAHNGASGLAALETVSPDLVMTDFRLGDMDGTEVLSRLKAKLPNVPILVITGYSDIRIAVNVMKLGAFDYITKPLFPQEILLTINKALDSASENPQNQAIELSDNTDATPSQNGASTGVLNTKSKSVKTSITAGYLVGISQAAQNLHRQINLGE